MLLRLESCHVVSKTPLITLLLLFSRTVVVVLSVAQVSRMTSFITITLNLLCDILVFSQSFLVYSTVTLWSHATCPAFFDPLADYSEIFQLNFYSRSIYLLKFFYDHSDCPRVTFTLCEMNSPTIWLTLFCLQQTIALVRLGSSRWGESKLVC